MAKIDEAICERSHLHEAERNPNAAVQSLTVRHTQYVSMPHHCVALTHHRALVRTHARIMRKANHRVWRLHRLERCVLRGVTWRWTYHGVESVWRARGGITSGLGTVRAHANFVWKDEIPVIP